MDIVQLSEIGLSGMLYDMFNNPMLQALLLEEYCIYSIYVW